MENLKIKVVDEDSAIESRDLFRNLGFTPDNSKYGKYVNWVAVFEDGSGSFFRTDTNLDECREITLQELRDMVVFKRNDPKDATHFHVKYEKARALILSDNSLYFWNLNKEKWDHEDDCGGEDLNIDNLKPIKEEVMKESLNDKVATAEVARQEEKHSHYKKDVSHLNMIDPYRIADLYDLHPCAEHIMKKSLCAGNRGHKDKLRDIQDIIDTAERWKQMIEEDSNEI